MDTPAPPTWLDLYDWRARVAALYRERDAAWRADEEPPTVAARFRAAKDELFAGHPQSPFDEEARRGFRGLRYYAYDPAFCVEAALESEANEAVGAGPAGVALRRAGRLRFTLAGILLQLAVYWIDVYGGGLFCPFRDATGPAETYGGGRYLFDTVKGSAFLRLDAAAGMGYEGGRVLLDFNYAYNPSCAYDPRWACPLAPRENWLAQPIRAGEQKYHD